MLYDKCINLIKISFRKKMKNEMKNIPPDNSRSNKSLQKIVIRLKITKAQKEVKERIRKEKKCYYVLYDKSMNVTIFDTVLK